MAVFTVARPANAEIRGEILAAATEIIETCGPDCVTMRQVAEKIGYSSTTIYLYFRDKNDVLKGTIKRSFEDMADMMASAAVGPAPLDMLRQRIRAYLVWGVMHPGLFQLMHQMPGDIAWESDELDVSDRGRGESAQVVRECVEAGIFGTVRDTDQLVAEIYAIVYGATSLAVSRRLVPGALDMSGRELIDAASAVSDALLESLLADAVVAG